MEQPQSHSESSQLGALSMCIAVDKSGSTIGNTIRAEKEVVERLCNFGHDSIRRPVTVIPWSDKADNPITLASQVGLGPSLTMFRAWGGTDPSSLYRSDVCLQALRTSRVWVLMTDGKIYDSLVETFANETTHHGLHNKAGIIIVFGDTSKGRPATCDISVGIALYTHVPDCVFLFHDVPTGVVRIMQAKGRFRNLVPPVGLERPKLIISEYTAWAELPRISYEQLFSVEVQTIRDLDADEIALQDGLIVNLSDVLAGRVDEATSEQIVRDRDNLRSVALASKARGTGKNLASWLKAQQKPLPKKSASPDDVDHRASLAISALLDAIRTDESPERIETLRERVRAAHEANLKDFWAKKANENEAEDRIRSTNVRIRNHYKRVTRPSPPSPPSPPLPPQRPIYNENTIGSYTTAIIPAATTPATTNPYAADNWGYDSDRAASPIGNSPISSPQMSASHAITPANFVVPPLYPDVSMVDPLFDTSSTNNASASTTTSSILTPSASTLNMPTLNMSNPSGSQPNPFANPFEQPWTTFQTALPSLVPTPPQPAAALSAISITGQSEKRKAEYHDLTDDESEPSRRQRRNRTAASKFREKARQKRLESDKSSVASFDAEDFGGPVLLLPGFRRRKPVVEYTGQCMLCHGTSSVLTLLLKTPPANRATADFPPEGKHAKIAFPLAMGGFAEMDVVSLFVPCDACAFHLLRIGACPVPGDVITGALCLVSLPENQSVWLEALDQAVRGRFDIADLMAMCVAILDAKMAENESRSRGVPSTEKELFRDCVGWTLRQLIQVLEVHPALSPSFADPRTMSQRGGGTTSTTTTTTTLGQLLLSNRFSEMTHVGNEELLLLRYPIQGFIVLVRLLCLLQLLSAEQVRALFFQKLAFHVMEQFVAQQTARTLRITDLLGVERKSSILPKELIDWGLLDADTLGALDGGGSGVEFEDAWVQSGPAMAVILNQLLRHSRAGRPYSSAVACFNTFKSMPSIRPVLLEPLAVTEEQAAAAILSMM